MSYKSYGNSSFTPRMKYEYSSPATRSRYGTPSRDVTSTDYASKSAAYTPEFTLEIDTGRASTPDLDTSYDYTSNYVRNYPNSNYASYVSSSRASPVSDALMSKRQSLTSDYSSIGRSPQSQYTSRYNSKTSVMSDYASTYRGSPSRSGYVTRDQTRETTPVNMSELFSKLSTEETKHSASSQNHREPEESHNHRHNHQHVHHPHHNHHAHCHKHHDGECDHKNTPGYLKHRYGEDAQPDEVVSLRQHQRNQENAERHKTDAENEKNEERERRPRARRSRLATGEQNGVGETHDENESRPTARRSRFATDDKADGKPAFKSRFAREVKMGGSTVSEPGKWVGGGFQLEPVTLTADRGHMIWTEPRGKLEVIFKYGHYDQNFSLFLDPQFKGVKVSEVKPKNHLEVIIDGKENPENSRNHHRVTSAARNKPENNFEFKSRDGKVVFQLEALRGAASPKANLFKINYTMAL